MCGVVCACGARVSQACRPNSNLHLGPWCMALCRWLCGRLVNHESTDVAGLAQLLVYMRYPWEGEIVEDFLFCKPLETRTTGEEILKALDIYMCEHSLK